MLIKKYYIIKRSVDMEMIKLLDDFKIYLKLKNPKIKQECVEFYLETVNQFLEFFIKVFTNKKSIYRISERQLLVYRNYLYKNNEFVASINTKLSILSIFENFLIDIGKKENKSFKKSILYCRNFKKIIDEQEIIERGFINYLNKIKPKVKKSFIEWNIRNMREYFKFADNFYKDKKIYIYRMGKKKLRLYRLYLKNQGYSVHTVNAKLKSLILYENYLIDSGIKKNQSYLTNIMYNEKERRNINNISRESYEQMIEIAKHKSSKHYLILILFAEYKIHTREIVKIKMKDISFNDKSIQISEKKIKLTEKTYYALRKYIKDRKKLLIGHKNDYLFFSHISRAKECSMEKSSVSMIVRLYYNKLLESDDYYEYWRDNY